MSVRVLHVITHLTLGGSFETTVASVVALNLYAWLEPVKGFLLLVKALPPILSVGSSAWLLLIGDGFLLRATDLVVVPSLNEDNGWVLVGAMVLGRPVGVTPEILRPLTRELLTDDASPVALAPSVVRMR